MRIYRRDITVKVVRRDSQGITEDKNWKIILQFILKEQKRKKYHGVCGEGKHDCNWSLKYKWSICEISNLQQRQRPNQTSPSPNRATSSKKKVHFIKLLSKRAPMGTHKQPKLLLRLLIAFSLSLHKQMTRTYCWRKYIQNSSITEKSSWCLPRAFIPTDYCPSTEVITNTIRR